MNDQETLFKGMRRIRYRNDDLLLADAFRSPYRWWWAYLRLSKDYWWVCQRGGLTDDQRLRGMYRDFGKVYEMTFEQWWWRRGKFLFQEQVALPSVRRLSRLELELSRPLGNHLLLEIPLNMTERSIIKQVRDHLRQEPDREVRRISTAKRSLARLVGIRQDVIESAYAVWKTHHESRDGRGSVQVGNVQGSKSLYQIGHELRLVRTCMPQPTDDPQRAARRVSGMKVAVSRMLARARSLIANATVGVFPCVTPLAEPVFWRAFQKQRMEEALAQGLWKPVFDPNEVLIVQQQDDER